jgi:hypothetical protein
MKMLSRSQSRLQDDKDAIVEAAEEFKRRVDICTWVVDNTQTAELWKAFDEVDQFGVVERSSSTLPELGLVLFSNSPHERFRN